MWSMLSAFVGRKCPIYVSLVITTSKDILQSHYFLDDDQCVQSNHFSL